MDAAFLETLLPFLKGFTIFFWATGTWWIPMLVILVVWRHLYIPLKYDPLYWGTVFPLGMYAVCTFEMVRAHESRLSAPDRSRIRLRGPAGLGGGLRWAHSEPCQ